MTAVSEGRCGEAVVYPEPSLANIVPLILAIVCLVWWDCLLSEVNENAS